MKDSKLKNHPFVIAVALLLVDLAQNISGQPTVRALVDATAPHLKTEAITKSQRAEAEACDSRTERDATGQCTPARARKQVAASQR